MLETRFPVNPYNFTTTITDPASAPDSANCLITYSGVTYSNTTATVIAPYPATDSFTNRTLGTFAGDTYWTVSDPGDATTIATEYGHDKTLKVYQAGASSGNPGTYWSFASGYTGNLNVSFWFRGYTPGSERPDSNIQIMDGAGKSAVIINTFYTGAIRIYNGATPTTIGTYTDETWMYVSIQINWAAKTFNVDIDLARVSTGFAFNDASTAALDHFHYQQWDGPYDKTVWLDAIDISIDPTFAYKRNYFVMPFLNVSQSFQMTGSYTYQFQAWISGTRYDCPAIPFVVVQATPNVQLISASSAETNWIFIDPNTYSQTTLYNSSFPYEDWTFSRYGYVTVPITTLAGDSWVETPLPDDNFGAAPTLYTETGTFAYVYLQMPSCPYLTDNGTTSLSLFGFGNDLWGAPSDVDVDIYATGSFDENTITYNTQPDVLTYLSTYTHPGNLYGDWGFATFNSNYPYVRLNLALGGWITYESKESSPVYSPRAGYIIGLTAQDDYHAMMQANTTETLTMRSPVFSTLNLLKNDLVQVTFNTTSQRQVTLNLKDSGHMVKSVALTDIGNQNFGTQEKTFVITDSTTIDQLEFTGLFENTQNLQIINITIIRPNFFTDIDLAPYSKELTYLLPASYELAVFEGGYLVMSQSITIVPLVLNKFSYTPVSGGQRIVSFFNPDGDVLEFNQFRCQITRTYNNLTVTYNLTTPYFFGDDGSMFQLNVTDRFGNFITSWSDVVSTFIDITLTNVYSLKIKNEMRLPTLLQLTRNNITQSEYAMAGEIVEYTLWNGTYQFNYTQAELNTPISINLNVINASIYNISTAYHSVYFSAFSNDGLGLSIDSVRLYIDQTRQNWGGIQTLGMTNVTVLDYINDTQYSNVLDLSHVDEMNIFVNIATVIINNLDNENPLAICIWKSGVLLQNQTVGAQAALSFRFTNGHYDVGAFFINGTSFGTNQSVDVLASGTDLKTYTLTWGSYHPDLPQELPTPGFPELLMLIAVIAVIGLIVTWMLVAHERSKRKESERLMYEMSRRGR